MPTPRLRVILHADDLGISHQVNDAIFYLMDEGKLTSASILANGPAFEDAARRSHHFPHCSFGVHLNITQFEPLAPCAALAGSLCSDGTFRPAPQHFAVSRASKQAIVDEWSRQMQRVREAGVPVSHIDSHHHMHARLSLLSFTTQLCREQSIRRIRIRQTFGTRHRSFPWRLHNCLYNRLLRKNFVCADAFGPFAGFADTSPYLEEGATVELMTHPGHPAYHAETQALQMMVNEEFRHQHQCISYRDLP